MPVGCMIFPLFTSNVKKHMTIFGREICSVSVIDMPAPVYHVRYTMLPAHMLSGCGGSVIETNTSRSQESCSYFCAKHNIECRAYSYTLLVRK